MNHNIPQLMLHLTNNESMFSQIEFSQ